MVISERQTKRLNAIWAILSVCASLLVRSCAQTQKNKPVNAGKNGMSNEKEITHLEKTLDRRRRWLWLWRRWRQWWQQRRKCRLKIGTDCRRPKRKLTTTLFQNGLDWNWFGLFDGAAAARVPTTDFNVY